MGNRKKEEKETLYWVVNKARADCLSTLEIPAFLANSSSRLANEPPGVLF